MSVLISLVDRWARSSQLQARRNAMIASTRLTQRRIEREEVDRYLAARTVASGRAAASRAAGAVSAHRAGSGSTVRVAITR